MTTKWIPLKDKTQDHWLEVVRDDGSKFSNDLGKTYKPLYTAGAVVKWDGCIDLRRYSNGYSYDHDCKDDCQCLEEYIHICDIDSFIEELQELKKEAQKHFGQEWLEQ